MLDFFRRNNSQSTDLLTSRLHDEKTFYPAFLKNLNSSGAELIIGSPFVTRRRLQYLLPTPQKLKDRRVRIILNTKDPSELDEVYPTVASLQHKGI